MKLSAGDIRFSKYGYASTTVEVWGEKSLLPLCSMDVSTPLVEGKALEQYKDELLAKAREQITEIYKEIVCAGNEVGEQSTMLTRDNLEERVALLEKHLHDAQIKPEVLNALHANIKKAIMGCK
ncbi:hypothetical protein KCE64_005361 [Salmonella enterica subsp. enterica serovar Hvittingfoss]|nr:hypothetical protein [Salmonella enterica subsp. enterica serovar Hvittingfoss]EHL2852810.1 hypothetical protein [Salmonella enterica subsp. enterica serovar Hvittingfoss]